MDKEAPTIPVNEEQIKDVLCHIEQNLNDAAGQEIFSRLGSSCFHRGRAKEWIESYNNDFNRLINDINNENKSSYWERLDFDEERQTVDLIGRPVSRCVCTLGQTETPVESLCRICCRTFQENLFQTLFRRPVEIEITESSILGGKRCSTRIYMK